MVLAQVTGNRDSMQVRQLLRFLLFLQKDRRAVQAVDGSRIKLQTVTVTGQLGRQPVLFSDTA